MRMKFARAAGTVLLLTAVPATVVHGQEPPANVQEWMVEIQQIQTELEPLTQRALQDESLQQEQAELTGEIRRAMVEADPSITAKLERMEEIAEEARAAQAAGNEEQLVALTTEAQTLQPQIMQAQATALESPGIEEKVNEFQDNLHDRMAELDPESRPLIERMKELNERVRQAMSGA